MLKIFTNAINNIFVTTILIVCLFGCQSVEMPERKYTIKINVKEDSVYSKDQYDFIHTDTIEAVNDSVAYLDGAYQYTAIIAAKIKEEPKDKEAYLKLSRSALLDNITVLNDKGENIQPSLSEECLNHTAESIKKQVRKLK